MYVHYNAVVVFVKLLSSAQVRFFFFVLHVALRNNQKRNVLKGAQENFHNTNTNKQERVSVCTCTFFVSCLLNKRVKERDLKKIKKKFTLFASFRRNLFLLWLFLK